jgi:hypothetical protein
MGVRCVLPVSAPPIRMNAKRTVFIATACYSTVACGGVVAAVDLAGPREFEATVARLCGIEPIGDPLPVGLAAALNSGRTTFEPAMADRCIAELRSAPCQHESGALGKFVPRLPGWCRQAYSGTLGPGMTCRISAECRGDSYCGLRDDALVCTARIAAGGPCNGFAFCSSPGSEVPDCEEAPDGGSVCIAD